MEKIKSELDQIIEDLEKTDAVIDHLIDCGLLTEEMLHRYNGYNLNKCRETLKEDVLDFYTEDYL